MQNETSSHADEIDLLALFGTLLDYRYFIIAVTLICTLLGITYALLATPIYQANALIQIEDRKGGVAGLGDFAGMDDLFNAKSPIATEIEILKSRMVIGQAVDLLNLTIQAQANTFPLIGDYLVRRFKANEQQPVNAAPLGLTQYNWGGAHIQIEQLNVPDKLLSIPLTLTKLNEQRYTLSVEGDFLLEANIGEVAFTQGILIQVMELHGNNGTQFTLRKLPQLNAIQIYQKLLNASEKGKQSGILSLSLNHNDAGFATQVLDTIMQVYLHQNVDRLSAEASNSLAFLQKQLPNIKQDMQKAESALNAYQISAKSANISLETQAVLDQLVKFETELSKLRLKQIEMDKLYTQAHPVYQVLVNQVQSVEKAKIELEKRVKNLPETQQELLRLQRDVTVSAQIYLQLLQKSQELDIARASTVGNVRIIDSAAVDYQQRVSPKRALIVAISFLFGGILSTITSIAHSLIRRGITGVEEIESLELPVFASIPFSGSQTNTRGKDAAKKVSLLCIEQPADLAIEALRSFHTSLHFTLPEAKNKIVMISGPSPQIGKSFICANLATIIAQAGKKVLLIDADMRKGHLHRYFDNNNQRGLSNLLSNQTTIEGCLQSTAIENLDFIPRGTIPPNPSELLLSARFGQYMQTLDERYDLIIIDTPPVLAVSDALIVGNIAASSFLAVRFGKNPQAEVKAAIKRFQTNGIDLKGAIFNAVEKKASNYYKYGYYAYQYDYHSDKK